MGGAGDGVRIRAAGNADVAALAELMGHLGYPTAPEVMRGRMERMAADGDYETLVAEREGRVVGMAGLERCWAHNVEGPMARLIALVVEPGERGRGTGAALVAAGEEWARAQGARSLRLNTATHRERTHEFYRRLGYEQTGLRFVKKLG